ncbi:siderophore biosynthesis protein [Bacteroidia bacterium]|nr:siderophore biosynthesis protein [Bacteroidia bacterium]
MNTLLHKNFDNGCSLAIGKCEHNSLIYNELQEVEQQELALLTAPHRRAQRTATLHLLHRVLHIPQALYHTPTGQPMLQGNPCCISIAHTRELVAVVAHPTQRVGIDMENKSRNFERVAPRFLSSAERVYLTTNGQYGLAWCAKEAAYKMLPFAAADFAKQMRVLDFEALANSQLYVEAFNNEVTHRIALQTMSVNNHWVVWGVGSTAN